MAFLERSSVLLKNLTSETPYFSMSDPRFVENQLCLDWFTAWYDEVKAFRLPAAERNKHFLSLKTYRDVCSMVLGFKQLCQTAFRKHPGCSVVAARTNSNVVENVFCQVRGTHGQNDNPTYMQYGKICQNRDLEVAATYIQHITMTTDLLVFCAFAICMKRHGQLEIHSGTVTF